MKTETRSQPKPSGSDQLIAEIRTESGKLTDTYQVSSDGKQLIVISRYENSSLSQPLSIRRVYDLGNETH